MITLLVKEILSKLNKFSPVQEIYSHLKLEKFPIEILGTQAGLLSFLVNSLFTRQKSSILVITSSEQEAENLHQDLSNFFEEGVLHFPWWGVAPYKDVSPVSSHFSQRAYVLSRLQEGKKGIVVTSLRGFLSPLPSPQYVTANTFSVKTGDSIDSAEMAARLQELGYLRVPKVSVKGEFAIRGEVIDIFIPDSDEATRLVIDFEEITEIRRFNPVSQASVEKCSHINIFPVREVIFQDEIIAQLEANLRREGSPEDFLEPFIEALQIKRDMEGAESFYPLCFDKQYSLLDYINGNEALLLLIDKERLSSHFEIITKEFRDLYARNVKGSPLIPKPDKILLDFEAISQSHNKKIFLGGLKGDKKISARMDLACEPPRSFFGNINYFKEELVGLINAGYKIYIFAVYEQQANRLQAILKDMNIEILPDSISAGFSLPGAKFIVISEDEIFGRQKRIPPSVKKAASRTIESFVDLAPGDFVVHMSYGIGLFKGIERIKTSFNEKDYIQLEYDASEMVFIPIEQVNLIQKYISSGSGKPKLDKIGGKGWEARKAKVRKSVEDLAEMLVRLYSKRQKALGFAYPKDTDWQAQFEAGFPYQETDDQLRCIEEVKSDMEAPQPMDRLVCGDVGYGKTEIALRAAFKAVMGGKQAALLAPTTILAEQHYENFCERFKEFPVTLGMLSRFRSRKEQTEIIEKVKTGEVDLVIGTHRLIQKDVKFKNLGLMIIDEEQRFGVKHKEKLKELKTSVDCLTLTATPIPRTLHMSLMKIRDMSILNTAPQNRMPIETIIEEFDEEIIAKAVRREVSRNGQVFYLHNRVRTIKEVHVFLQKLMPEITMDVAHGQMEPDELEDIMHRFIHNEFNLLISTTIIENGIDIPNVNTIIIDRADMYGISQLYQLKGRVGRSQRTSYAYLLYPKDKALTELAMKRLRIISDYTELGSGFKIALKDLEIRGAGNLLGREQSGEILAVGFDMYLRLLEEALAELGADKDEVPQEEVLLELEYSGFIPDNYVPDAMEKMEVYKKLASISDADELSRIHAEIEDRFGPMPDSVSSILSIAEIRIICKQLYISSLKERQGTVEVEFAQLFKISVDKVLRLITESGGKVYLDHKKPNCLYMTVGKIGLHEKSEFIRDRLSRLMAM